MSVIQLPNGKWAYRFQVGATQYRRQALNTRHEAEEAEALRRVDVAQDTLRRLDAAIAEARSQAAKLGQLAASP